MLRPLYSLCLKQHHLMKNAKTSVTKESTDSSDKPVSGGFPGSGIKAPVNISICIRLPKLHKAAD